MKDLGLLIVRLIVGGGLFMHGFAKLSAEGGMDGFTESVVQLGMPMPEVAAWAAALSESVGGAFIALGIVARIAAVFPAFTMVIAVTMVHWTDVPEKLWISSGMEMALLYLAGCLAVVSCGAGALSVDRLLFHRA